MSMGGVWVAQTRDSQHRFDLDSGTVERIPPLGATPTSSDGIHGLRPIWPCAIGGRGFRTIAAPSFEMDHLWALQLGDSAHRPCER